MTPAEELAAIRARHQREAARTIHDRNWRAAQDDRGVLLDAVTAVEALLADARARQVTVDPDDLQTALEARTKSAELARRRAWLNHHRGDAR